MPLAQKRGRPSSKPSSRMLRRISDPWPMSDMAPGDNRHASASWRGGRGNHTGRGAFGQRNSRRWRPGLGTRSVACTRGTTTPGGSCRSCMASGRLQSADRVVNFSYAAVPSAGACRHVGRRPGQGDAAIVNPPPASVITKVAPLWWQMRSRLHPQQTRLSIFNVQKRASGNDQRRRKRLMVARGGIEPPTPGL